MTAFIEGITGILSGIFNALVTALGSMGNLLFNIGENGTITGPTGFGYFIMVAVGLPLATWLFSKVVGWLMRLTRIGR